MKTFNLLCLYVVFIISAMLLPEKAYSETTGTAVVAIHPHFKRCYLADSIPVSGFLNIDNKPLQVLTFKRVYSVSGYPTRRAYSASGYPTYTYGATPIFINGDIKRIEFEFDETVEDMLNPNNTSHDANLSRQSINRFLNKNGMQTSQCLIIHHNLGVEPYRFPYNPGIEPYRLPYYNRNTAPYP